MLLDLDYLLGAKAKAKWEKAMAKLLKFRIADVLYHLTPLLFQKSLLYHPLISIPRERNNAIKQPTRPNSQSTNKLDKKARLANCTKKIVTIHRTVNFFLTCIKKTARGGETNISMNNISRNSFIFESMSYTLHRKIEYVPWLYLVH